MALAPYFRGTADPRAAGLAEGVAAGAFDKLNKAKKKDYMDFMKRKLGEWYRAAPQGVRQGTAKVEEDGAEEPGPGPSAAGPAEAADGESSAEYMFPMD